jgi:hypothetical protein
MAHTSRSHAARRRLRIGAAVVAATSALLAVPATQVHAAEGVPYQPTDFTLSPTIGPAGGPITVHGTCHGSATVVYELVDAAGGPNSMVGSGTTVASPSGTWTVVDATGPAAGGQRFSFGAYCVDGQSGPVDQSAFARLTYTVAPSVAVAPSTTTSTTSTVVPTVHSPAFTG